MLFGTLVKVITGFYVGCAGPVMSTYSWDEHSLFGNVTKSNTIYHVDLVCKANGTVYYIGDVSYRVEHLQKITKEEWDRF